MKYKAIVIGASAGGLAAIRTILDTLPEDFSIPILIVQHLNPRSNSYMVEYLKKRCKIQVKEADEKERIVKGKVYIAPPNYHLMVERDGTLSLTVEPKVNYSRPSIDVLFHSAAESFGKRLIGIILTGANKDGSEGLRKIKELGGVTIVQDPNTAEMNFMPEAAIAVAKVDYILPINIISKKLIELVGE